MTSNLRKAVVIGGAGFLGRRLVEFLVEGSSIHPGWPDFDTVVVFDMAEFDLDRNFQSRLERSRIGFETLRGDILSYEDMVAALEGAHTVFHMASIVYVGLTPDPLIDAVNIEGTRNVIDACRHSKVPFLVYTSSEDVVLSKKPVRNGDESLPYPDHVIHDYVRTKIEGEKLILAANDMEGLRTCSIRPVHIYGPGDPHAIIPSLRAFAKRTVPFLLGDGTARFDVVYVDNVVHAHLLAAAAMRDPLKCQFIAGEAFFIGENNRPNYFDWLRPLAESKEIRMPTLRLSFRSVAFLATLMEFTHRLTGVEVPFHKFHLYVLCLDFYFSNAKAERLLGYKPIVAPENGMQRTIEWLAEIKLDSI